MRNYIKLTAATHIFTHEEAMDLYRKFVKPYEKDSKYI